MIRRAPIALLLLVVFAVSRAAAADYQVVVHPSNPTDIVTREILSKIFLKKLLKWDTGTPMVPVDQPAASPLRVLFTKLVHGKPVSAIASYWQQQIFAGKDVPPAEKAGDAAVIAFVKGNPGSIGYVSAGIPVEGLKLIIVR